MIIREGWRRAELVRNADYLRQGLIDLGYDVGGSQSQIISLEPGSERLTFQVRDALAARGVFVSAFTAPATAKNRTLVRFSVNSALSRAALDRVLAACAEIREPFGYCDWPSTRRRRSLDSAAA